MWTVAKQSIPVGNFQVHAGVHFFFFSTININFQHFTWLLAQVI